MSGSSKSLGQLLFPGHEPQCNMKKIKNDNEVDIDVFVVIKFIELPTS